jgi:hypothetical protein
MILRTPRRSVRQPKAILRLERLQDRLRPMICSRFSKDRSWASHRLGGYTTWRTINSNCLRPNQPLWT